MLLVDECVDTGATAMAAAAALHALAKTHGRSLEIEVVVLAECTANPKSSGNSHVPVRVRDALVAALDADAAADAAADGSLLLEGEQQAIVYEIVFSESEIYVGSCVRAIFTALFSEERMKKMRLSKHLKHLRAGVFSAL